MTNESHRRADKRWLAKAGNLERRRAKVRECQAKARARLTPEERKRRDKRGSLSRYGLTIDDYERLYNQQHGVCFVCGDVETAVRAGVIMTLAVDHDHETNAVRALLCCRCNRTIGMAGDDPDLLEAMAEYLRQFK